MMHVIFRLVNWEILLRIQKQRSVENTLGLRVTRPCSHFDPEGGYSLFLRNVDILTLANGVTTGKTFSNHFTWVEQHFLFTDMYSARVYYLSWVRSLSCEHRQTVCVCVCLACCLLCEEAYLQSVGCSCWPKAQIAPTVVVSCCRGAFSLARSCATLRVDPALMLDENWLYIRALKCS